MSAIIGNGRQRLFRLQFRTLETGGEVGGRRDPFSPGSRGFLPVENRADTRSRLDTVANAVREKI